MPVPVDRMVERLARFGATVLENPWIPADHRRPPAEHPDRQAPTEKQAEFLMLDCLEALYGGAAGGGKMLDVSTPIPTPSGWVAMGDLAVGDWVLGEDGRPCRVLCAYPVVVPVQAFRIVFDDGSAIDACGDHRWLTFDAAELSALTRLSPEWREARREKRPGRTSGKKTATFSAAVAESNRTRSRELKPPPTGTVRTTAEIAVTLRTPNGRVNHAVPLSLPLDLPAAALPIDPYVLGVWLGDGTSRSAGLTTPDTEVIEQIRSLGWSVRHRECDGHYGWVIGDTVRAPRAGVRGIGNVNSFAAALRGLGVSPNKHIPAAYLRGNEAQRLALLQGLMDTDGTACESGSVEFTTTSRALADGVHELIVSLGSKAQIHEGRAMLHGLDCGPKWRIKWTPRHVVFRLSRKAERQKIATRRTTSFRYVVACDPIPPRPMRCITVDNPTGLFLCGRSMIPTHNSDALLMAALQYVEVPGYSAGLFRKSYSDLSRPGALMDRARRWLAPTTAKWNDQAHTFTFPSGATLMFGYLDAPGDEYRYQGTEFNFLGVDELTQIREDQYRYLFSRLRRLEGSLVPLRVRAASNPGGIGHDWVKQRFLVEGPGAGRVFVPARLRDNPHLEQASYERSLAELDPVKRAQLLDGDWNVQPEGELFKRHWFKIVEPDKVPSIPAWKKCRFWDLAATEAKPGTDPDWTAGALVGQVDGVYYVLDIRRARGSPQQVEALIRNTAEVDGRDVRICMEQEPGSSGVAVCDHYARRVLVGWPFHGMRSTGSKVLRAAPASSAAERGNVVLVRGAWLTAFLDEADVFPRGSHDDQIDAFSGAFGVTAKSSAASGMANPFLGARG